MALFDPAGLAGPALVGAVCLLVFVESGLLFGFFLPGDTVLYAAGLACANPGTGVGAPVLALAVGVSAVLGDSTGYALGRHYGRPALLRRAGRRVGPQTLARAEQIFDTHGAWALVVARFIPWVRTLVPLLAGASQLRYRRFLAGNIAGALSWGVGLVLLGRLSADLPGLRAASLVVAGVVVVLSFAGPAVFAVRRRRAR